MIIAQMHKSEIASTKSVVYVQGRMRVAASLRDKLSSTKAKKPITKICGHLCVYALEGAKFHEIIKSW